MITAPSSSTTNSPSPTQRREILDRVVATLEKRFYSPERLNNDWRASVTRHRPTIEAADAAGNLEGFFHSSARRASSRAALSATYLAEETPFGRRWIFQDVHTGGAAAIASNQPGDILLSVDGKEITPPEHPVFAMGEKASVEILGGNDQKRRVSVDVARPKGRKLHFVEPKLVEARHLGEGVGYLKVTMFPGLIGVEVANEISGAVETLGTVNSLIVDLRGNTGGGIGALRVMRLLTPDRLPVGFALDRNRLPSAQLTNLRLRALQIQP